MFLAFIKFENININMKQMCPMIVLHTIQMRIGRVRGGVRVSVRGSHNATQNEVGEWGQAKCDQSLGTAGPANLNFVCAPAATLKYSECKVLNLKLKSEIHKPFNTTFIVLASSGQPLI